ncbi:hypothetical protein HY464_02200, partial [Candidatus Peregrinibacteria bacterium]|nr:hypothetical protein [Candidatus Peregrinibacteria bacterium]
MKRYDGIAFAGALGALAGLSVAIVNAWEVLPTILSAVVCMGVAGVAYRPLEILMVVVNACRALPGAVRSTPQWFGVRKEQLQKGIRATLFVIGCIALALLSFLAIPMLLFLGGVLPNLTTHRGEHLGIGVDILVLGGALFAGGLLTTFYLLVVSIGDETPPWALRIGKAFERMIDLGRRINEMEQEGVAKKKWAILLLCLCVPVFAQILSIGIVVFLLDVLST